MQLMADRSEINQALMAQAFILQSIENERSAEAYRILSEKAEKFYGVKSKDFDYSSEKATEYLEDIVLFRHIARTNQQLPDDLRKAGVGDSASLLRLLNHLYDNEEPG
jgi:hypothetical protein